MKFTVFFAAAFAAGAVSTYAAPVDPMAGYYANTFVMDGAEGKQSFHINKDKSWIGRFPENMTFKGTWRIQGKKLCFDMKGKDAHPHCFDGMLGRMPGAKWQVRDHGKLVKSTIVAGRR